MSAARRGGYYRRAGGRDYGRGSVIGSHGGPPRAERLITDGLGAQAIDTLDYRTLRFVGGFERDGLLVPASSFSQGDVSIKSLQCIGSYNWTDSRTPTILVPGSPPIWREQETPFTLQSDGELFGPRPTFIDQNGYRMPSFPLYPLVAAVNHCNVHDPFDWHSVDVVTDRNGLRKLVRYIEGSASLKEFRIDIQLAGEKTVLLSRWESRLVVRGQENSYGFSFEKFQTEAAKGCEEGTGHHRIVTYDLNGLCMVVRFEVDACFPTALKQRFLQEPSPSVTMPDDGVDELALMLSATRISKSRDVATLESKEERSSVVVKAIGAPALNIRNVGELVSQKDLIELTTRSERRAVEFSWREAFPQLWLSQTPNHFLAVHNRGTFTSIQRRTINGQELQEVAAGSQESFRKLHKLLAAIQALLIEHGREARLSLICRNGTLEVFERTDESSVLPEVVLEQFMM